jgi:hypothetical protein
LWGNAKNNGVDCVVEHELLAARSLAKRNINIWTGTGHLQTLPPPSSWWLEGEETPRWNV